MQTLFGDPMASKNANLSLHMRFHAQHIIHLQPWDRQTVFASVRKTNRAVIAHEHYLTVGIGGEISASITSELFSILDAPVGRIASKDVPVGFAKSLEAEILLNVQDIKNEILKTVNF